MEPFKNAISPEVVRLTGHLLAPHLDGFDERAFVEKLTPQLDPLALKERVGLIAEELHAVLPKAHNERYNILCTMLHPEVQGIVSESSEKGLSGWAIWPLTQVVGSHGLGDFEASLSVLRDMTNRFTAEFDVRPFIVKDQEKALAIITAWADHPDEHVRRLVSEGTRPRLPWGVQLKALVTDPEPMLETLKSLRDDPSEYVRRSVANHLNDIAKDHPDLVASIAKDWLQGASKEREKLVRHACRTLIKQGHRETLAAFGLLPPQIVDPKIHLPSHKVNFGEALEFEVELRSTGTISQSLVIDYVIHFLKANGTLSQKVFKWSKLDLAADEIRQMSRKHAIKPITTRVYYEGTQKISLRINGQDYETVEFELLGVI